MVACDKLQPNWLAGCRRLAKSNPIQSNQIRSNLARALASLNCNAPNSLRVSPDGAISAGAPASLWPIVEGPFSYWPNITESPQSGARCGRLIRAALANQSPELASAHGNLFALGRRWARA